MTDDYPTTATDGPWRESDRERSVLADSGPTRVVGHTLVFAPADDAPSAAAARRFAFASALSLDAGLPPGIAPTVRPMVESAAERTFAQRLRERGLADVERGRRDRLRTDAGRRARLRRFTATYRPDDTGDSLAVEGWLAVWSTAGEFRVAGGAYPTELPDCDAAPGRYREELLAFVRGVE